MLPRHGMPSQRELENATLAAKQASFLDHTVASLLSWRFSSCACQAASFIPLQLPPTPISRVGLPAYIPWSQERFDARRREARGTAAQPLVPLALAVALGLAVDRYWPMGGYWLALGAASGMAWWIACRRGASRCATGCLLLCCLATGGVWHHAHWRWFAEDEIGRFATLAARPICLEAVATDAPTRRSAPAPTAMRAIPQGEKTQLQLRATRLRDGDRWRPLSGNVELIVDGHLPAVHVGDRLRIFGSFRGSNGPRNEGQFDFAANARADRTLALVRSASPDCVRHLAKGSRLSPWRWLANSRATIEQTLWRQLGHRRAPIAAAMLVGARQGVSRDRAEPYRQTGTLHVLVVSGLHVGLVVGAFYIAARIGWFPRRQTLLVVMVLIAIYALLTGARPPVVRAAVLAEMICLAALFGRQVLAINSLAAATLVVLCWNPSELFRSGPQLSFIAAATLIWFGSRQLERRKQDPMTRLLASVEPWHARRARAIGNWAGVVLLATLAVWITTAPLLATRFNLLSPVALPISLAVFPLVATARPFRFAAGDRRHRCASPGATVCQAVWASDRRVASGRRRRACHAGRGVLDAWSFPLVDDWRLRLAHHRAGGGRPAPRAHATHAVGIGVDRRGVLRRHRRQ